MSKQILANCNYAMLKKALWLDAESHIISFNQLECFNFA